MLAAVLWVPQLLAQDGDSSPTVDALRTPEAPGFILLGGAPSAVERPTDAQAFVVSVITRATEGDLFDSFGVQVSPFWFGGLPDVDYADFEAGATGFEAIRRTLTFSLVADRLDLNSSPTPSVGFGIRMSLATGSIDKSYNGYEDKRVAAFQALADQASGYREAIEADPVWISLREAERDMLNDSAGPNIPAAQALQALRLARAKAVSDSLKLEDRSEVAAFTSLKTRRNGFVLDIAGGWSGAFLNSEFSDLDSYRWGLWGTAGYTEKGVTVLGVARYLDESDLVATGEGTAFDLGARFIADVYDGALSLSAEGIYRFGDGTTDDRYRLATEVSYDITSDRTLAFTFGRDFDGESNGNVLAIVRLIANFGEIFRLTD